MSQISSENISMKTKQAFIKSAIRILNKNVACVDADMGLNHNEAIVKIAELLEKAR